MPDGPFQAGKLSETLRSAAVYGLYPLGISRKTVDQYLAILEKYFLIFRLPAFSRNLHAQRPFNAYFWRTTQGYEIDLVLESTQTQEVWAFQITASQAAKANFSRALEPTSRPASWLPIRKTPIDSAGEGRAERDEGGFQMCKANLTDTIGQASAL